MVSKNRTLDDILASQGLVKIKSLNQDTRDKAVQFIHTFFPEIWSDIQGFSEKHKLNVGDVAGKVIGETIYPILEQEAR